ncbi:unnamed protein product, partial [Linum tenue]
MTMNGDGSFYLLQFPPPLRKLDFESTNLFLLLLLLVLHLLDYSFHSRVSVSASGFA